MSLGANRTRSNILFLVVDALRADRCRAESRYAITPAVGWLRRNGTTFTQAISTTATTSPSFGSILTATYPPRHGIRYLRGYRLRRSAMTLPEILRYNGYNTYAEVTGPLFPEIGLGRGFDTYRYRETHENVHSEWGSQLIERFENRGFAEPWFVLIHFWELHLPRVVPENFENRRFGKQRYDRALSALDAYLMELLSSIKDDAMIIFHADHGEKLDVAETPVDKQLVRLSRILRRLDTATSPITDIWPGQDAFQRPLVEAARILGKQHVLKNASETGHGFNVYDYLVRVPLVFVDYDVFPEDRLIDMQVSQVDILPTIVEGLGLRTPTAFRPEGRSLMPVANGQGMQETYAFLEESCSSPHDRSKWLQGLRTRHHKFIYSPYDDSREEELYDLRNDPRESRNLARQRPRLAENLRQVLQRRQRYYDETERIRRRIAKFKRPMTQSDGSPRVGSPHVQEE